MTTIIKPGAKPIDLEGKLIQSKPSKRLDAKKFSGILKLDGDPIDIQKRLKDEWA